MATYIMLANFTDQGIKGVKDTVKRAEAFTEQAKASGVTVKDIYWALGQYDIVSVVEAADDMAITALGLSVAKTGNIRTQTLRAFSKADMTKILGNVA
ncbi:MAG: GYD domain-containing protein [Sphingomonadales bacterium]|nr:GYD domain-containing protein [Sphingomonadales bacterium]